MKTLAAFIFVFGIYQSVYGEIVHQMNVELKPLSNEIFVKDTIRCQAPFRKSLSFKLHAGLVPKLINSQNDKLHFVKTEIIDQQSNLQVNEYFIDKLCDAKGIEIFYQGKINHPIKEVEDPYSRGTAETPGLITETGVVLSSATYWYPILSNQKDFIKFNLSVKDDLGFSYMTSGEKIAENEFVETTPQEEIYLIGARFQQYSEIGKTSNIVMSAYLRNPDQQIAAKYLSVTDGFLDRYNKMIGNYPYKKFDLVENFWDTGFGMPSFTLLGENIIRLPFIINTSYPHEVLHNWWGNSVYVDYQRGNWCEGLTSYMADHHNAELSNMGAQYRRDVLNKYTEFVTDKNEFPLSKFIGRFSAASEAIGYGKSLMLFHMLRMKYGNDVFKKSLSGFYNNYLFKNVSYAEIQKSFEMHTGEDLTSFFAQWVERVGAPVVSVKNATVSFVDGNYHLKLTLLQDQNSEAFSMQIPLVVSLKGESLSEVVVVDFNSRIQNYDLVFKSRPYHLRVDPEFDVFRKVSVDEIPPTMTMALGAKNTYFILPKKTDIKDEENIAYMKFVKEVSSALSREGNIQIFYADEVATLPSNANVWVLGYNNQYSTGVKSALKDQDVQFLNDRIIVDQKDFLISDHSFVFVAREQSLNSTLVQIASPFLISYEALAKKLVHYGKYGSLVFKDEKLLNVQKGIWAVQNSRLSIYPLQTDGYISTDAPAALKVRKNLEN